VQEFLVQGNISTGSQQGYGVILTKYAAGVATQNGRVEHNNLRGNGTGPLSITTGNSAEVHHNDGYVSENEGVATFSGDGSTTVFNIAHGLAGTPTKYGVSPLTPDADADRTITADATNIIVTFSVAPPAGTDNVKFGWWAKL